MSRKLHTNIFNEKFQLGTKAYLYVGSLLCFDLAANIHKQNGNNNHLYNRRETDSPLHMLVECTAWNSRQNNPLDILNYSKNIYISFFSIFTTI